MYYEIRTLTNCAKKYANFLNDYEPYQEIRDFRRIDKKFDGFSTHQLFLRETPVIKMMSLFQIFC